MSPQAKTGRDEKMPDDEIDDNEGHNWYNDVAYLFGYPFPHRTSPVCAGKLIQMTRHCQLLKIARIYHLHISLNWARFFLGPIFTCFEWMKSPRTMGMATFIKRVKTRRPQAHTPSDMASSAKLGKYS